MADTIPRRDAALLTWALSASGFITAQPTSYGLTATIATGFASAVAAYQTALDAVQPGIRNKMAVVQKNSVKLSLVLNIRNWSKIVDGTASVTNTQRTQLGLNVRAMPTPVPAPSTAPNTDLVSVIGRTARIKIHDGVRRGKPATAIGASIFSYIGATPPASLDGWKLEGSTGRSTIDVTFPSTLAPGATVWICAYWIGTRKEAGPVSEPLSITFGAAGVSMPLAA